MSGGTSNSVPSPKERLNDAINLGVLERLDPLDMRVLEECSEADVYVDDIKSLTTHRLAWLLYHRLLAMRLHPNDDVTLETTSLGKEVLAAARRSRRRLSLA